MLGFLQRADLQVWSDVEEQPGEVGENGVSYRKKSFSLSTEGAEFTSLFFGSADLEQSIVVISAEDEFVREYHAGDVVNGILATDMFPGDTVNVTLKWRVDAEEPLLELDQVVHGTYGTQTDMGGAAAKGSSGCADAPKVCEQNVRCVTDSEVLAIATGIVFITINRTVFEGASGTFLNNDRGDCDPLILSAQHAIPGQISPGSARYYYNHEVNCDGSPVPLKQGTTGSTLLASWEGPVCGSNAFGTDFSLLRLRSVPASWTDVSMNGWDAGLFPPRGDVATIHHPNSQKKEIAVSDNDDLTTCTSGPGYAHVVPDWEYGGTRNGSSGAPLFASDGQVIGQLNGGGACGCDGECVCNDKFGSLTQSFIGAGAGAPDSSKLEPWLTPSAPGINTTETSRLNCWPEIIGFGRVSSSSHRSDGTTTYTFSASEVPASVALITDQEIEADEVLASGEGEYTAVFSGVPTTGPRTGTLLVEGLVAVATTAVEAPLGLTPASSHSLLAGATTETWQISGETAALTTGSPGATSDICIELEPLDGLENYVSFSVRTWTKAFYSGLTLRLSTDGGQTWRDSSAMVREGRFPQFVPGDDDGPLAGQPVWSGRMSEARRILVAIPSSTSHTQLCWFGVLSGPDDFVELANFDHLVRAE